MNPMQLQSCIEACYRCAAQCDQCAGACLDEREASAMVPCIRADLDCADICRAAAAAMARGSAQIERICRVCAEVCDACASECARHTMQHCQDCARACRECANACRSMLQAA